MTLRKIQEEIPDCLFYYDEQNDILHMKVHSAYGLGWDEALVPNGWWISRDRESGFAKITKEKPVE